jgi:hypothetical protein
MIKRVQRIGDAERTLRVETQHLLERLERLFVAAGVGQGQPEVVVGPLEITLEPDGLAEEYRGLRAMASRRERQTQTVQGFGRVGPEADRLAIAFDRLLGPLLGRQSRRQVQSRLEVVAVGEQG